MKQQQTRVENEFQQELSPNDLQGFNTLQAFSTQPTTMLETTLTDTLGLSMHNAIMSQQQSQMTTAASITNACARLLQAQPPVATPAAAASPVNSASAAKGDAEEGGEQVVEPNKSKPKSLNLFKFLKKKPEAQDG